MKRHPIKQQQYDEIMNYLESDRVSDITKMKLKRVFVFLYYTGVRINEMALIKGKDIQTILDTRRLAIYSSKTNSIRTLLFRKEALPILREAFATCLARPNDPVLTSQKSNSSLYGTALRNKVNLYLFKVFGNNHYTSHSFREGLLTEMMIDHAVNPRVAQKFIGHKNIATTLRYTNPTMDDVEKAMIR